MSTYNKIINRAMTEENALPLIPIIISENNTSTAIAIINLFLVKDTAIKAIITEKPLINLIIDGTDDTSASFSR
ncbi:hypothetical protein DDR15_11620 [Salmonella enterica]|nr:hypothetical protein [Salmonella enterica]